MHKVESRHFQLNRGQFLRDHPGFLLVFQPVALALDVDGVRVVQQPVQNGAGDHVVRKNRAPVALTLVGRQDHRTVLVAIADQLKHSERRQQPKYSAC